MKRRKRYPTAVDPTRVGSYPAGAGAGGGYVWDEVLEYRVWCHHSDGDYFYAFATYPKALAFSRRTRGAEEPLALVLQRQCIDEPSTGKFVHIKTVRRTEWPVEFLARPKRNRNNPGLLVTRSPVQSLGYFARYFEKITS